MRRVVAATAPELEQRAKRTPGVTEKGTLIDAGFLGVFLGRRQERPPLRQLAIHGKSVHDRHVIKASNVRELNPANA